MGHIAEIYSHTHTHSCQKFRESGESNILAKEVRLKSWFHENQFGWKEREWIGFPHKWEQVGVKFAIFIMQCNDEQ